MSVLLATLLTESIVTVMDLLLKGQISFDYLITGLVASLIVASLICAMIIAFLEQLIGLKEDNVQLSSIVTALPVPLALFDAERNLQMLNPKFTTVFGYEISDIPSVSEWRLQAFPDTAYRETIDAEWQKRLENSDLEFQPLEIKIRCKNGLYKHVMATATRIDRAGRQLQLVMLYDISKRIEAMNALAESRSLLQSVIETIPMRVFWKDGQSRYLGCNSQFARDCGLSGAEDILGKTDNQLSWRDQAEIYRNDDRLVMHSNLPKLAYEEPQTTPDGREILLRTSKAPLRNSDGKTVGVLGVYDDITDLKKIENELWLTKTMIDKSKTAFFCLDPQGVVTYVNDYACQSLGYAREELVGMKPWEFDPDLLAGTWPGIWDRLRDCEIVSHESRHRRKDGTTFPVELTCHYIAHNGFELSFTFAQNISERKRLETELRIAATAFESQEGMMITDADTVIVKVNKSFSEITGYSSEEAIGQKMNLLNSGVHDTLFFAEMWNSIDSKGVWQGEIWNRRKNGNIFPEWLTISAVKGADDSITHYVGTMMDITARKAIEQHIHHLAHFDALTDLPNRTLLIDRLHQAVAQARREHGLLALLYLDLDKFKPVNDSFGHDVGDLLLKEVANRLEACVKRETDTVSRLGGDEFVILLSQLDRHTAAELVAENILVKLNQPFVIQHHTLDISSSVGIAIYPDDGLDANTLIKNADYAMYQAKCAGRGCFRFFRRETAR
ncbi:diguanylate cyclase/phosphodiesterase (GGDEF & EAL domains) with PAS/PAC sensor(s) [Methylomonas albis]|nr:diguanylate cyclase/phosphodiesterase (GGDEF & EAL domains) with PAS/PAC sensor(s) [Methylomonas albis]